LATDHGFIRGSFLGLRSQAVLGFAGSTLQMPHNNITMDGGVYLHGLGGLSGALVSLCKWCRTCTNRHPWVIALVGVSGVVDSGLKGDAWNQFSASTTLHPGLPTKICSPDLNRHIPYNTERLSSIPLPVQ
jgi:hypothetical protein